MNSQLWKNGKQLIYRKKASAACLILWGLGLSAFAASQSYDTVLRGGRVMDPESGLDAVRNVGIRGGKISAITTRRIRGLQEIDAQGLVVTAGFIDLHSHGQTPEAYSLKARDGVTTALELEIGVDPVKRWYAARQGTSLIHFGASVGHVLARMIVMNDTGEWLPRDNAITKTASADERRAIRDRLNVGLDEGALGIGFGFSYTPKAVREELQELFELAAKRNRLSTVHMRYSSAGEPGILASLHEVVAYAAITGGSIHIAHIGASSTRKFDAAIDVVRRARKRGLDISVEAYPYVAGMTRLETAIFDSGFRERLGIDYKDLMWVETGERLTKETYETYRRKGGLVAAFTNTEEMIRKNMADPLVMVASDGIIENGKGHPRSSGTYARMLGKYVREEKATSLMDALRKMSLMPAQRLEAMSPQMRRKGRMRVGADADIVVFDPEKVIDRATFTKPNMPSEGIPYVMVEGTFVVRDSQIVPGVFPGQGVIAK